jgi:secreted trypsin-like serine protease
VLTAAHCVIKSFEYEFKGVTYEIKVETNKYYPTLESMYRVYLGLQNRTTLTTGNISPAIYVSVEKIKVHESYDEENVLNDIALLQLKKPVQLNRNIQIACLPNAKWSEFYPLPDTSAWVLGWGTLSEQGKTPDSLMNLKIEIYNNSICDQVIREDRKDWKSQICAGDIKGNKDTCQGDSGGGIYVKDSVNNRPKYISAGIVSYGDGCGKINKPG